MLPRCVQLQIIGRSACRGICGIVAQVQHYVQHCMQRCVTLHCRHCCTRPNQGGTAHSRATRSWRATLPGPSSCASSMPMPIPVPAPAPASPRSSIRARSTVLLALLPERLLELLGNVSRSAGDAAPRVRVRLELLDLPPELLELLPLVPLELLELPLELRTTAGIAPGTAGMLLELVLELRMLDLLLALLL